MKKWENRENLPATRANHRGVNIGDAFLVIGGWGPEPPPPATTTPAPTLPGGSSALAFTGGAPTFMSSIFYTTTSAPPLSTTYNPFDYTELSEVLWFENPKTQPKWTRMNSIQTPRQRHAVSVIKRTEMAAACVRWIRSPNYPDNYPNRYDEVVIIDLHHIIFVLSLLYISKCKII